MNQNPLRMPNCLGSLLTQRRCGVHRPPAHAALRAQENGLHCAQRWQHHAECWAVAHGGSACAESAPLAAALLVQSLPLQPWLGYAPKGYSRPH